MCSICPRRLILLRLGSSLSAPPRSYPLGLTAATRTSLLRSMCLHATRSCTSTNMCACMQMTIRMQRPHLRATTTAYARAHAHAHPLLAPLLPLSSYSFRRLYFQCNNERERSKNKNRSRRELNPGLPRDRRRYSPLYYMSRRHNARKK
jgi:hypothetical protein